MNTGRTIYHAASALAYAMAAAMLLLNWKRGESPDGFAVIICLEALAWQALRSLILVSRNEP